LHHIAQTGLASENQSSVDERVPGNSELSMGALQVVESPKLAGKARRQFVIAPCLCNREKPPLPAKCECQLSPITTAVQPANSLALAGE